MDRITATLAGLLFGAGVTLSGMINPMKVQNFLDIFGAWDPTLLFVMGGALAVTFVGYAFVLKRPRPLYAGGFSLPEGRAITPRLIAGAVLFGAGWGLTGFCPGPALASLVFGLWPSVIFVLAMAAGIIIIRLTSGRSASSGR